MERGNNETGAPVGETVLQVVCELRAVRIGESTRIYAPSSPVVVVKRGDLELVKVTCKGGLSGVQRIVSSGVDAALKAVLDDNLLVDPDRPAGSPCREMVLEMEPTNAFVLGGVLR